MTKASDAYNKLFGKPSNPLDQLIRDNALSKLGGGGGGGSSSSGQMSVSPDYARQAMESAIRIASERRAAENAAKQKKIQTTFRGKVISQQQARLMSQLNTIAALQARKGNNQGIPSYTQQSKKILTKLWSNIVPPEVRKDYEKQVSRLEELRTKKRSPKENIESFARGLTANIVGNIIGVTDLPKTLKYLRKNPFEIKKIPGNIWSSGKEFVRIAKLNPNEALGRISGEAIVFKGTSAAIKKVSSLSEKTLARTMPDYVGEAKVGKKIKITVNPKEPPITLEIVKRIPRESISSQVSKAGKVIKVATSSQGDSLIGLLRRSRTISKPLGMTKQGKQIERALSAAGKKRLRAFERGKITQVQLLKLNKEIRKLGSKGVLERSFFADPTGKIRPSRLGIIKPGTATLKDYLSGNITFRKSKPQILIFKDVAVAKFPKNLRNIVTKLMNGKNITSRENAKLLQFQLRKTGKFKPLGFVTRESEITLAPGEIIKRVKRRGTTLINGRKVPIIEVKVYKPRGQIKTLLKDLKIGKINSGKLRKLDRLLKKETGMDYRLRKGLSSRKYAGKKYVSLNKLSGNALLRSLSKYGRIKSKAVRASAYISRKTKTRKYGRSGGSGIRPRGGGGVSRPRYGRSGGSGIRPRGGGSSGGISRRKSNRRIKPRVSSQNPKKNLNSFIRRGKSYNIFAKTGRRYVRINRFPLNKRDALNRGAYAIDNSTAKTLKILPARSVKRWGIIKNKERGYFARTGRKFRQYRIIKGKKKGLDRTYIERKKYGIDTRGEKRQLSIARLIRREGYLKTSRKSRRKIIRSKAKPRRLRRIRKVRSRGGFLNI